MRVVHVLGPLRRSGAEMMLLGAIEAFASHGMLVEVISLAEPETSELADDFERRGITVTHVGEGPRARQLLRYWKHLRGLNADCTHVHAEGASIATELLARATGTAVVRTVHGNFDFRGVLRFRKIVERWVARRCGVRFVAVSGVVERNERTQLRNHTTTIPNWIDEATFRPPTANERTESRASFGAANATFVISIVGNCSATKNHQLLFDSLRARRTSRPVLVLHAGNDAQAGDERERAAGLPAAQVQFLGPVSDVRSVLWASDAFVMPSLRESLGLAAVEAGATGLRAVLANSGGLAEVAERMPRAHLVPTDVPSFVAALDTLIEEGPTAPDSHQAETLRSAFGLQRGVADYVREYLDAAN